MDYLWIGLVFVGLALCLVIDTPKSIEKMNYPVVKTEAHADSTAVIETRDVNGSNY